mgnify:CR=1 FL=1
MMVYKVIVNIYSAVSADFIVAESYANEIVWQLVCIVNIL